MWGWYEKGWRGTRRVYSGISCLALPQLRGGPEKPLACPCVLGRAPRIHRHLRPSPHPLLCRYDGEALGVVQQRGLQMQLLVLSGDGLSVREQVTGRWLCTTVSCFAHKSPGRLTSAGLLLIARTLLAHPCAGGMLRHALALALHALPTPWLPALRCAKCGRLRNQVGGSAGLFKLLDGKVVGPAGWAVHSGRDSQWRVPAAPALSFQSSCTHPPATSTASFHNPRVLLLGSSGALHASRLMGWAERLHTLQVRSPKSSERLWHARAAS